MTEQPEKSDKKDLDWVKSQVETTVRSQPTKRLWQTMETWLKDDGEGALREKLKAYTQTLRSETLSSLSNLKPKLPEEE